VERIKEGDGFVRFRWGETKEQDAVGGARLTIEIGADFAIGPNPRSISSRTTGLVRILGMIPARWLTMAERIDAAEGLWTNNQYQLAA
jgi:hypothetical protein